MKKKKIIAIFTFCFTALLLQCCKSSMLTPTLTDETIAKQKWNDASLTQLSDGFHLYVNKCAGCHYLHNPKEFTVEKWEMEIPDMCKRAFVSAEQQDLILRYVLTKRENLLSNSSSER